MMIPNRAHFIWLGDDFPWLSYVSVLSCLKNGGFDEVNLHFLGPRKPYPNVESLMAYKEFRVHFTNEREIFRNCGTYGERLESLFEKTGASTAVKSDILRYAILYSFGGVYFDCDFLVLRPMQDILSEFSVFVGTEKILAPYRIVRSRNPITWLILKSKVAFRLLCAKIPKGYLLYNRLRFRDEAFNNALIGSVQESAFLRNVIESLFKVDAEVLGKMYYIGPYLLQNVMNSQKKSADVGVFDSTVFFPVSPIVSEHLFRKYRKPDTRDMVFDNTRAIHWYSSTFQGTPSAIREIGVESPQDGGKTTMFSELLREFSIL